jgi:hypothetical protein
MTVEQSIRRRGEPARMTWLERDAAVEDIAQVREESGGDATLELELRWKLHEQAFGSLSQRPDLLEERFDHSIRAVEPCLMGDGARQLDREAKARGTLAAQRSKVAGLCGRWKVELISTALNTRA